ncbi:hypothetical protein FA048_11850 [Pedobacter polaris]|uniref:Uncharacterized protein n=1 Tax=Pedobacter polaris TaxID=2571273 RepID=A0A4U1CST8_9SPHI|nr:hypothetical protein [Pedobacter polaris]TKC10854.1 hypothetical protein FA048_11850 [Pedobacter polaris]
MIVVSIIIIVLLFLAYKAIKGYSYLGHKETISPSSDKKQITINKHWLISVPISFVIGFLILLAINHFGKFSYLADTSQYNPYTGQTTYNNYLGSSTPVTSLSYKSPFNTKIDKYDVKLTMEDIWFHTEKYNYATKLDFYVKATLSDYLYIFLLAGIILILITFFKNFKLKIN